MSRQLAAVASPESREHILELALTQIGQTPALQAVFAELDINQLDIHAKLQSILRRPPTVAIPIDAIPRDLTEWARTLRNTVWIWVIEKFVSVSDSSRVLYSIPDETVPTISTEPSTEGTVATVRASGSQLWRELLEAMPDLLGTPVFLEYGPRGTQRRKFEATIREDGVEISGNRLLTQSCRGALHEAGRQPASHGERLGDVEDRSRRVSQRPLSTNSRSRHRSVTRSQRRRRRYFICPERIICP